MFRRFISILVLASYCAGQLAAIPHAHGAASLEEQQRHDATPHVHWFGKGSHQHSHSHLGAKHDHSHHDAPVSSDEDSDSKPFGLSTDSSEHDADAFYFAGSQNLSVASRTQSHGGSALLFAMQSTVASWTVESQAQSVHALPWHPPDVVLDDSGTYLILRTLRI